MVSSQSPSAEDGARMDDLGVKALELMQQLVNLKLALQEHFKVGSINLAKSRYIMGNSSVSVSQLPTEDSVPFKALCRVEQSKTLINGLETPTFMVYRDEPKKKLKSGNSEELSDLTTDTSCDPLHWFGVLVPQNLRLAQESFKKALELTAEIASVQAHLESIRIEFCTLKLQQIKIV